MPAAVVEEFGLAYFSVPKSGSTSMKMVLYELKHGRPWAAEPDKVHPEFRTFPITVADLDLTRSYFTFTIVRDPIERLLSAYGNRVHVHRDIDRATRGRTRRLRFRLSHPGLRLYPSAKRFYRDLDSYQEVSYSIWHHTTSVSTFIGSDLSYFDRVYRLEDIPLLEQELGRRTGRAIKMPREQTSGPKLSFADLPVGIRRRVLEHTESDYELLSGFYSPPRI